MTTEGWQARLDGKTLKDNPHPLPSDAWFLWSAEWRRCDNKIYRQSNFVAGDRDHKAVARKVSYDQKVPKAPKQPRCTPHFATSTHVYIEVEGEPVTIVRKPYNSGARRHADPRYWSPEEYKKIESMIRNGARYKDVAKAMGANTSQVAGAVSKLRRKNLLPPALPRREAGRYGARKFGIEGRAL